MNSDKKPKSIFTRKSSHKTENNSALTTNKKSSSFFVSKPLFEAKKSAQSPENTTPKIETDRPLLFPKKREKIKRKSVWSRLKETTGNMTEKVRQKFRETKKGSKPQPPSPATEKTSTDTRSRKQKEFDRLCEIYEEFYGIPRSRFLE